MSWNSYLDNLEILTGHALTFAAIYGKDGDKWTSKKWEITPTPDEISTFAKMGNDWDWTGAMRDGIVLGGVKFQILRIEATSVYFENKAKQLFGCAVSTKTALVVNIVEASYYPKASIAAKKIAEDLESKGI